MTSLANRRAARRQILPGFPRMEPFADANEMERSFGDAKAICMLCGKEYRSLGRHISAIHDWTTDQYREHYGIPWGRGLVAGDTWRNYSKAVRSRINRGQMPWLGTKESNLLDDAARVHRRAYAKCRFRVVSTKAMRAAARARKTPSILSENDRWLCGVLGATELSILAGLGGRSDTVRERHPGWPIKWRKALSKRWKIHVAWSLTESGLSKGEIAKIIGTSSGTINQYLCRGRKRRIKSQGHPGP